MLIDIHAHILPGMDDGPSTLEKSIRMALIALEDGIHTIIATPHCHNGVYFNSKDSIISACERFNQSLRQNNIDLIVLPGCEAHLSPEILDELERDNLLTLNDNGRYLSVELPDPFIPGTAINFINRMRDRGIVPVITHPERNSLLRRDMEILRDLISAGALSQVTAASITGHFGKGAMRSGVKILKQGMAHLIASDAHSTKSRPPILSEAIRRLSSIMDDKEVKKICYDNPGMVIRGEVL